MTSPRWRKVLRDLWSNKTRTILVVLSIAVGVFAVGTIVGTQAILPREMRASYASVNPASATLYTTPFDDDFVNVIRGMKEVGAVEGRRSVTVRLNVGPDEWRNLQLFAIPDYDDIQVDIIRPEQGAWPPGERALLIERAALSLTKAQVGDRVLIETPGGKQRELRIVGLAHDLNQFPSPLSGTAYGYITFDTLEWLGEPRNYNELHIVVAENKSDKQHIKDVAIEVRDKVEKSGGTVFWTWLPEPGKHPADEFIPPMLLLLGALGLLSLLASGFLVINTISAILTQQVRQIGVMKAVGARSSQIAGMYLGMVVIFCLLSLAIAVPLGAVGAFLFTRFMAGLINFDVSSFSIPAHVLALEVAVGLVVPLLAALWPITAGTRVTVREAISTYGLGKGRFGKGPIDRMLERVRGLSRPMLLSLRNTFRRKGRLALTLSTLTLSGAIFVAVFSVRASLLLTLDDALEYWKYDVGVTFSRPYRVEQIEREALKVPGVVAAESWGFNGVRRVRADDTESGSLFMVAPPARTKLLQPTVLEGRWLLPEDENALVVNTDVTKDETDIKLGDEIVLKIDGRETTWRVVGVTQGVLSGPIVYANYPYFSRVVRNVGRAGGIQIVTEQRGAAFQSQVAKALEEHFERVGMRVSSTETVSSIRERVEFQFNIIIVFLVIMAVLLATVGALGLMGTMSINVIERTREIGVMRAIGASNGAILRIVIVEGVLIGVLSWLVGAAIALPMSKLLSDAVGMAFMQAPLSYTFSTTGALIWLGGVIVLAALASFLPARSASRLSVREVLAYE